MSNNHSNRFPHAGSPLCAVPVNADDPARRVACAAETVRNASDLLDVLGHYLEDSETTESAGQWTLLNVAQRALTHALQLLEESPCFPATAE